MKERGLDGSTLKLIAILTMLIDHVAAAFLARLIITGGVTESMVQQMPVLAWARDGALLYQVYTLMRKIGRIAFPIFCFLLSEGFWHTKNRRKYALRLGLFVLVSEIPFDLAFSGKALEFGYQNVFCTLFLGLLCMMLCYEIEQKYPINPNRYKVLQVVTTLFFMGIAEVLRTDYGASGIMCIMVLYFFRFNRMQQLLAGAISFLWELPAPAAFLPIACYNGKRGWNMKYFFYLFYPVHLLLIYLMCQYIGLGGISVV